MSTQASIPRSQTAVEAAESTRVVNAATCRQRVLFLLTSLDGGGAQRVMTTVLRHLPADEFDRHLAVVDMRGRFLSELPPGVEVHDLKAKHVRRVFWALLRLIHSLRPAVVFSTLTRLNLATTLLKPLLPAGTRIVIREANVADELLGSRFWRSLTRRCISNRFSRADALVCQSEFMRHDLHANLSLPLDNMVVIYNPVDCQRLCRQATEPSPFPAGLDGPHVVGIGSLRRPKKGFDRLIVAFPALLRVKPTAHLWILGEGPLEQSLRAQADALGIGARVHFPGFQANPFCWLKHADLFVLASRFEGTPNVLLEAMACDCPVVVLDHPGGTRELMQLTGQESRMVDSLVPWNQAWFHRPQADCVPRVEELFGVEAIARQYRKVLADAGRSTASRRAA